MLSELNLSEIFNFECQIASRCREMLHLLILISNLDQLEKLMEEMSTFKPKKGLWQDRNDKGFQKWMMKNLIWDTKFSYKDDLGLNHLKNCYQTLRGSAASWFANRPKHGRRNC